MRTKPVPRQASRPCATSSISRRRRRNVWLYVGASRSALAAEPLVQLRCVVPIDSLHEGIDIRTSLGAIVHVIGVFVHVERNHRPTAGDGIGVIGRPLIDQSLVMRRIRQQYPTGTAAFRLAHRGEFGAPAIDAAEIARYRVSQRASCRPAPTETVEIGLMQNH